MHWPLASVHVLHHYMTCMAATQQWPGRICAAGLTLSKVAAVMCPADCPPAALCLVPACCAAVMMLMVSQRIANVLDCGQPMCAALLGQLHSHSWAA